jgi:hypothetical protein
LEQALRCIDFEDYEPEVIARSAVAGPARVLADNELFLVELCTLGHAPVVSTEGAFLIIGSIAGVAVNTAGTSVPVAPGGFCLLPACIPRALLQGDSGSSYACIRPGRSA